MNNNTYNIVAIRTKYSFSDTADDIIAVKLDFGYVESVPNVVSSIDFGSTYYYTDNLGIKSEVESVHPQYGAPYIRTKANTQLKIICLVCHDFSFIGLLSRGPFLLQNHILVSRPG